MSNWLYENKVIDKIEDFPKGCFGFVYKIVNKETNQFYIGKKFLSHKKTKKLSLNKQDQVVRNLKKLLMLSQTGKHIGVVVNHY